MRRAIPLLLVSIVMGLASAPAALAEKRVALVIGNSAYVNATPLPNPKNDAEDVSAALKRVGFETIVGVDLDQAKMQESAIAFARAARDADVALFYYSGHAMQFGGVNYLMPVDAKLTDEADLRRMARVDDILADLQQARNLRILVLDSCRDNPFTDQLKRSIGLTRAASLGRGLARVDAPQGMIVAFATQEDRTADDGKGRNSPYTTAFLKHIETQGEIGTLFRRISTDVYEATERRQLPELKLSMIGEYYLRGEPPAPSAQPSVAAPDSSSDSEKVAVASPTESLPAANDPVLVRVNGADIRQSDLDAAISEHAPKLAALPAEDRRKIALQFLIETQLMAEQAEKSNLAAGQSFEGWSRYKRRRELREVFYQKRVREAVTEDMIKSAYDAKISELTPETEVRARHILVATEAEAKKIAARLRQGVDFATLANEKSIDRGAEGGDVGFFPRGQMIKAFEDAAFALEVGQISKPVKTQFGWHIIKVEEKRNKSVPSLEDVRASIAEQLVQQKAREVLENLQNRATVQMSEESPTERR
jgi:uncharacterized caspase-like protein